MNIGGMMGIGGGRMPDLSAMREKMFQKADGNGDQALSLEEFQQTGKNMPMGKSLSGDKAKEAFGKIDSDGNGSLSKDEMKAFGDRMSSEMQGAMVNLQAMMGGGAGGTPGGMMGGGMPDPSAMFGKADEDKDGKVSRNEFGNAGKASPMASMMSGDQADAIFGQIDGDGDGALTQEEMRSFGDKMREQAGSMTGGATSPQFQQALNAYRQGSSQNGTDLTSILLKALDSKGGTSNGGKAGVSA
jgi:Ca2+-binding EF-hand superfamily protein